VGKIEANFFLSLDGVVERPDQWHFPYFKLNLTYAPATR
jgi:hypothetical protein